MRLGRSDDAGRNRRCHTRHDRIFGKVKGRWPGGVRSLASDFGVRSDQLGVCRLTLVTLARAVLEFLAVEVLHLPREYFMQPAACRRRGAADHEYQAACLIGISVKVRAR